MTNESAFFAVRHQHPELVRQMRLALDVGANIDHLLQDNQIAQQAYQHMQADPSAGVVKWDGMRYTWA